MYLVRGNDPVLRGAVVDHLVDELLGDDDRTLALEDHTIGAGPGRGDDGETGPDTVGPTIAVVINAATSPPFMTGRRVVVVREVGALTAAEVGPLLAYLDDPLDTTELVLVAGGGTIPVALTKRLKEVGAGERAPASERTTDVLAEAARAAGLSLRPDAMQLAAGHLGSDAGRVAALVDVLVAAYGDGAVVGVAEITPYLTTAGAVPSYELTNAIERGDVAGGLEVLGRLLGAASAGQPRPMHPLQVFAILHSYYRRILRLDDAGLRSPADAVTALGGKVKEYPARKALDQARALGTRGVRRAFDYLAQAELDLKGARGIPADAVLEILVSRLAGLSGRARGSPVRSRR
jgi:DNA polymerase-3 subunit delta